jgi:DNA primase
MGHKYDLDALKNIDVAQVIELLGGAYSNTGAGNPSRRTFVMHCCNSSAHNMGDLHPSLKVYSDKNTAYCPVCAYDGLRGDPIAIATFMKGGFKAGCEWLHDVFRIPFLDGETLPAAKPPPKPKKTFEIKFWRFQPNAAYSQIEIEAFLPKYQKLKDSQRLKMVYTHIYRFSLKTDQQKKLAFYAKRGVADNPLVSVIGYISETDVKNLQETLKVFPDDDLKRFLVINEAGHFKGGKDACVVPSFDLYTDMVTGLMFRPQLQIGRIKELQMSVPSIIPPLSFGLGRKTILREEPVFFTEGHIDALSLPIGSCFVANPGVNTYHEQTLGLLQGRSCVIAYDMDKAGAEGAAKLSASLTKAGANVSVLEWDKDWGKDLNELLEKGRLEEVLSQIKKEQK